MHCQSWECILDKAQQGKVMIKSYLASIVGSGSWAARTWLRDGCEGVRRIRRLLRRREGPGPAGRAGAGAKSGCRHALPCWQGMRAPLSCLMLITALLASRVCTLNLQVQKSSESERAIPLLELLPAC